MQRRQNVARDFKHLSPEKKVVMFLKIYNKMSAAGSVFINPSLVFTYLLGFAKINAITTALNNAADGGDGTTDAVAKAVIAAEKFIDNWADLVDLIANGDSVIIISSGFDATKANTTPGEINGQPILDFTPQKQAGSVLLQVEVKSITVDHPTVTYVIGSDLDTLTRSGDLMYCTDVAIRLFCSTGKKEALITGLPAGTKLQCVCVITSAAGVSIYSNVIKFQV
jgi:hypothetical protein